MLNRDKNYSREHISGITLNTDINSVANLSRIIEFLIIHIESFPKLHILGKFCFNQKRNLVSLRYISNKQTIYPYNYNGYRVLSRIELVAT